ncbi:protein yippee-like 5 isoform X4 [Ornithorhynchus anatinus]|uniref:protein yippee-like 5 isoform X4 n=1 Tax=Ornithorhynchus anatinus TaxID=9258 RepID=UPI0010A781B5|nr:protein yippee-like 5 isoform X4 [Ornithorhynchus anatinus]
MLVTGATGVYGAIAEQRASWTRCRSDRSPFPPEKDRRRSSVPVVCLATSGYIGETPRSFQDPAPPHRNVNVLRSCKLLAPLTQTLTHSSGSGTVKGNDRGN